MPGFQRVDRTARASVVDRRVLRRRSSADLQDARMVDGVGGDALEQRQAHAPVVAEIEHVAEPLPDVQSEFGDRWANP